MKFVDGANIQRGKRFEMKRACPVDDRLQVESDKDEILAVVVDESGIWGNDGPANIHERVESTSETLLVLLAVEADNDAVARQILVGDFHQVDESLAVELAAVGRSAIVEGVGVVDGRREGDGRVCSETGFLCDVLGEGGDLYAILAELGEVVGAKDGRQEARLVDGSSCARGGGREGELAVVVALVVRGRCGGQVAAEGGRQSCDIGDGECLCACNELCYLLCRW